MSTPATSYRLFYPDSNTLNAVTLFNVAGNTLIPQSITDGTGDPAGYKSKIISFAAASEPLFATPTFADPGTPVSLYLCRDDSGTAKKVLDESVFDPINPGRPTAHVTSAQEYLLYAATDIGGGVKTYALNAPANPVSIIKDAGKDAITGADLDGNTILLRWSGLVPTKIEVECDIEDITDPGGYFPIGQTNVTTYAESSVGLSLVQATSQIVPQDGMSHVVTFRLRYNVAGDVSPWVVTGPAMITYDMASPNVPLSLSVQLLRDRIDTIPDVVRLSWQKAAVNPGTGIDVVCYDYLDKKHTVYSSNGIETECRIENVSRFVVQDTGPAVARPYRFAIVATNISAKSDEVFAATALNITSKVKEADPLTPDEIAGTAVDLDYATLKATVFSNVLSEIGTLPPEGQTICNTAVDELIWKIKDVVAKGGSVTLQDFGVVKAKWTNERLGRNPSTGEPVVIAAYRSLGFSPSTGFKTGTKQGVVMTDEEAK